MQRKNVLIRIVNKSESCINDQDLRYEEGIRGQADGVTESFSDTELAEDFRIGLGWNVEDDMPMIFETDGEMTREDGKIKLSFTTVLTGVVGTDVEYIFDENERELLTVVKKSVFEEVYFFDGNTRRQNVVFNADGQCPELSICTKHLNNQLTYEHGGFIEVEYYAEVRAGLAEHCKEYVLVEPK